MDRRSLLRISFTASAATLFPVGSAFAEWKPRRPLNVIVPYKAGGGIDAFARAVSAGAKGVIPVPVVIVNKPGSSGITGATAAASARPDGNNMLLTSSGSLVLASMMRDIEVDPFESFQTVAQIGNINASLAVPANSPYQSAADLVEDAKARPGELRWAHNGRGSILHVAGEGFLGANAIEAGDVPFKGGAAVRAALIGNQLDFGFIGVQQGLGFENEMRILAINAPERDAIQQDIPTFAELGFDYIDISTPVIMFAPNGVDKEVVTGLEAALKEITAQPEFIDLMQKKGNVPAFLPGAEAEARLQDIKAAMQPIVDELKSEGG